MEQKSPRFLFPESKIELQHSTHFKTIPNIVIDDKKICLKGKEYQGPHVDAKNQELAEELKKLTKGYELLFFSGVKLDDESSESRYGSVCFKFNFDDVLEIYKQSKKEIKFIPFGTLRFAKEHCHICLICDAEFKIEEDKIDKVNCPFDYETKTWKSINLDDKSDWEQLDIVFVLNEGESMTFKENFSIILKDHNFCVQDMNCREKGNCIKTFSKSLSEDYIEREYFKFFSMILNIDKKNSDSMMEPILRVIIH